HWIVRLWKSLVRADPLGHARARSHDASAFTQGASMAVRKTNRLVKKSTPGTNGDHAATPAITHGSTPGDVKDPKLARAGKARIEWADRHMPVLRTIRARFAKERPLKGMRIGACLHVTTETANLARTLQAGGAQVFLCGSNPLSTQDDVAAALVSHYGIPTFAIKGEDHATYYSHIVTCLEARPHITMDDGCDLVTVLHTKMKPFLKDVFAGTEETSTGVTRLR